ncbi:hypothetical protein M427DRAFT_362434 [Gonapodya prolifera JEL478]|uniref:Uncharacterized protein n=1 Tax=Gonapodya prolifera (strain JEL478) TaxID=1344416 RepID=A0A139AAI7_GONPJ|nr:hypothetical protein M427DRAFT_362434 [Gonapodya prolifera JEL478]|eukprot:KXS13699.1 hypothetical protein M427DRAFT_362434 [Gonapodya prolifera JEL478]
MPARILSPIKTRDTSTRNLRQKSPSEGYVKVPCATLRRCRFEYKVKTLSLYTKTRQSTPHNLSLFIAP